MSLPITIESVLTGAGFADVPASPLQLALVRAADGLPLADVIDADECQRHFGTTELPALKPRRIVVVAGIRGGKSMISCCAAISACLSADLSTLKRHELPRFPIVAPTVDAARATFVQLCGIMLSSKVLRSFLDGEPTADTLVIRRPDGRRIELVVVAAHRGGLSVRNRWLAGFVLEEVASFGSEASGAVVNAEEILRAAAGLPGLAHLEPVWPRGPSLGSVLAPLRQGGIDARGACADARAQPDVPASDD